MDNQHRQIKGYRELTQTEIDLMNEIKLHGAKFAELIQRVRQHVDAQHAACRGEEVEGEHLPRRTPEQEVEVLRLAAAEPGRWASIAKTHFQEGCMALTRAVAQPTFF